MWNGGGAQMTAVVAMGVVVIAVVVSVQPGSILKDLIAGLGAAGQVFFAGMVWKLSREQFKFTKDLARKQEKIDLMPSRGEAVQALRRLHTSIKSTSPDWSAIMSAADIKSQTNHLFSRAVSDGLDDYMRHLLSLRGLAEAQEIGLKSYRSPTEIGEIMQERADKFTELNTCWHGITSLMQSEMKVT